MSAFYLSKISRLFSKLEKAVRLIERRCPVCHEIFVAEGRGLSALVCPTCRASLARREAGYCPDCGELMSDPHAPCTPCGNCLKQAPPWASFRFHGVFEGALREALHRAKYSADNACITLLSYLLDEVCRDLPELDAIIPMPLHPSRLRERGFNQCREIVRLTARRHHLPIRDELLVRIRNTSPQTSLSRKARLENLNHAFEAPPDVKGLRILLVDDTATTGTSLRKGSEALLRAGAARVDVAVIARTGVHGTN